jgi:pyridoxal phosphate enzyme (YggS family)
MSKIAENLKFFQSKISGSGTLLIAVSKTHTSEAIMEAYHAGHREFGENKVQELVEKAEKLPKDIRWHMIGHLQRNKVKYIAPFVHLIHSIDSFRLLEEVNKAGGKVGKKIGCLLQVYIATEESKFGFDENELIEMLGSEAFRSLENVEIKGLMGMASFTDDLERVRQEFAYLKSLSLKIADKFGHIPFLEMSELSMGMSNDFSIAIEEGSTMVRIGSSIFGNRHYS